MIVGTKPAHMKLQLKDKDMKTICEISDTTKLGDLNIKDNKCHVHVLDVDPLKSMMEFTDVSKVEKYVMDDEEYDKRKDSVRQWKRDNLKGHYAKEAAERQKKKEAAEKKEVEETKASKEIKKGDRCQIKGDLQRRGEVQYVGEIKGKEGIWVGITLDEPLGKNDGSVNGQRYFTCMPRCGAFTRPTLVDVGDYPEEDIFDEL